MNDPAKGARRQDGYRLWSEPWGRPNAKKAGCGKLINMLNLSDQTEFTFVAMQKHRVADLIGTVAEGS
jgi:hypothetical protein